MELIFNSWAVTAFIFGFCFRLGWVAYDLIFKKKSQKKHGL